MPNLEQHRLFHLGILQKKRVCSVPADPDFPGITGGDRPTLGELENSFQTAFFQIDRDQAHFAAGAFAVRLPGQAVQDVSVLAFPQCYQAAAVTLRPVFHFDHAARAGIFKDQTRGGKGEILPIVGSLEKNKACDQDGRGQQTGKEFFVEVRNRLDVIALKKKEEKERIDQNGQVGLQDGLAYLPAVVQEFDQQDLADRQQAGSEKSADKVLEADGKGDGKEKKPGV